MGHRSALIAILIEVPVHCVNLHSSTRRSRSLLWLRSGETVSCLGLPAQNAEIMIAVDAKAIRGPDK